MSGLKKICVCVVGGGGVGKSCITVQYINGSFKTTIDPTIIDTYTKQISVDDQIQALDILDTAGQDELTSLRDLYTRNGDAFIVVYDVTNKDSYEEIERIYEQFYKSKDETSYPTLVVANKVDLEKERVVSVEDGNALVARLNKAYKTDTIRYIEASAKTRLNIDEMFEQVVRMQRNFAKFGGIEQPKDLDPEVKPDTKKVHIKTRSGGLGKIFASNSISGDADDDLAMLKQNK